MLTARIDKDSLWIREIVEDFPDPFAYIIGFSCHSQGEYFRKPMGTERFGEPVPQLFSKSFACADPQSSIESNTLEEEVDREDHMHRQSMLRRSADLCDSQAMKINASRLSSLPSEYGAKRSRAERIAPSSGSQKPRMGSTEGRTVM